MTVARTLQLLGPDGTSVTIGALAVSSGSVSGFTLELIEMSPASRPVASSPLPLVEGALVSAGRLTSRQVRVGGMIVASSAAGVQTLRSQLARVLGDFGESEVLIRWERDGAEVELAGYLDGILQFASTGSRFVRFDFTLTCQNPVALATEPSSTTITSAAPQVVTSFGAARVWPYIEVTITGDVTGLKLGNSDTGETLELAGLTGMALQVECRPGFESVLQDGTSALNLLSDDSRFPAIRPGSNELSLEVTAGTGSASASVSWRDGWSD